MSDYKRKGYTKKSLDMLKSREGQSNAIFACFGSTVQHAQYLEKSLAELIKIINKLSGENVTLKKKPTIGNSLFILEELQENGICSISKEGVYKYLENVKEARNWLAHEYFLDREDGFKNKNRRMGMLHELVSIGNEFEAAESLANGVRIAIQEQMNGNQTVTNDENVLFTIELKSPDD